MTIKEADEVLMNQVCSELIQIAEEVRRTGKFTMQQLEVADRCYHLKKGMLTCEAMEESKEEGLSGSYEGSNMSGRRGRAANGQYTSRDMNTSNRQSYEDGYSRGYADGTSNAMGQNGQSGHYPVMPPAYPRTW